MKSLFAVFAIVAASAASAGEIVVEDAFARVARPGAPTGAAFMVIRNTGDEADTLIGASSTVAKRVELHTHIMDGDVIKMRPIEGGIEVDADGSHALERGGDHVMLMGLTEKLEEGMEIEVTLTFETAGDIVVTIPVDNQRGQSHSGHGKSEDHSGHKGH